MCTLYIVVQINIPVERKRKVSSNLGEKLYNLSYSRTGGKNAAGRNSKYFLEWLGGGVQACVTVLNQYLTLNKTQGIVTIEIKKWKETDAVRYYVYILPPRRG